MLLLLAPEVRAQTVFGRITDAETGTPLEGAHVFIAGSLLGTVADQTGRYELRFVPAGSHRVVASMVGFELASLDTVLVRGRLEVNLALSPVVIPAGEIEVSARASEKWQKNLERFDREFLGLSRVAQAARLLNPEVLDFESKWWGRLNATAQRPLVIENPSTGYRSTYYLEDFRYTPSILRYDGDPVFEELEPDSLNQPDSWDANRSEAFKGSFRHFLLALIADSTREQGFRLYRRPSLDNPDRSAHRFPLSPERIIAGRDSTGITLRFTGYVEIIYEEEEEEEAFIRERGSMRGPGVQQSWIKLSDGPTVIDWLGSVVDPYGITVYGYLAFERVGDDLPKEYRPPGVHLNPSR